MALKLGFDGMVDAGKIPSDGCCVPSLCAITPCMLACNFVNALPCGPLWDKPKRLALLANTGASCDAAVCPEKVCNSIVSHAIYTANRLWSLMMDSLAPALRESDPFTAYDTIDDWLKRLGWVDCFNSACRDKSLGHLTPLEVMGECCAVYSPPTFDPELILAVKIGVVRSLTRLQHGPQPNIERMNFVLEPLGAKVTGIGLAVTPPLTDDQCEPPSCTEFNVGDACCPHSDHPVIMVDKIGDTLSKPDRLGCASDGARVPNTQTIIAYHDTTASDPVGLPPRIWPGLLAAECILRSVIYPTQNIEVQRCC